MFSLCQEGLLVYANILKFVRFRSDIQSLRSSVSRYGNPADLGTRWVPLVVPGQRNGMEQTGRGSNKRLVDALFARVSEEAVQPPQCTHQMIHVKCSQPNRSTVARQRIELSYEILRLSGKLAWYSISLLWLWHRAFRQLPQFFP